MLVICSEEEAVVRRLFAPTVAPAVGGAVGGAATGLTAAPAAGPPAGPSAVAAGADGDAAASGKRSRRQALNLEKDGSALAAATPTATLNETSDDLPPAVV